MCDKTISVFELMEIFPTEASARIWFENQRWNGKPACPFCGSGNITTMKNEGYYECRDCIDKFTVRVGTVMHRSHIPLRKWLFAMYLMVTSRKGISSVQLSKELGITQKSAWFLLQRIREGCASIGSFLKNVVEVDETFVGGKEKNKHADRQLHAGRGPVGKQPIFGMRERKGDTKAFSVSDTTKITLQSSIQDSIIPGSTIYTDDSHSYFGLSSNYVHETVCHSVGEYVNGMAYTNGIESVWAILKRGFNGIYHKISLKHLDRYLDEFTFRLNQGNVKIHTLERIASMARGMFNRRLTYEVLIGKIS